MWRTVVAAVLALSFAGCATPVQPVARSELVAKFGFLQEGRTTRHDVIERMGAPRAEFEKDRVLTYWVSENALGKMDLRTASQSSDDRSYSLVLAFDEHGVLRRHSLVPRK